jgi:ubiquinone/menaquinone biosynthesis C-methylase UbiE
MNFNHFTDPGTNIKLDESSQVMTNLKKVRDNTVKSIPRFVESDNYAKSFGSQWNKFKKTQLDSHTKKPLSQNRLRTAYGKSLNNLNGLKVLEAGCGSGRFTEILLKHGAELYSFDYSNAVDANYDNNMPNNNLTLFQADIRKIPFSAEFFDVVICLGVLQHTPSTQESIKELNRVTKKNGRIVVDHYKFHFGHYLSLYFPTWFIIKNLPSEKQLQVTDFLTKIFFPLHWFLRNSKFMQLLLRRISPICFYYGQFDLSKDQHYEFSRLDTHDKNTDQYKRHLTLKGFHKMMKEGPYSSFEINSRGNGLECIAIKK